jgi:glycosyltransferase involved in cell wall biosynthesis
MEVSVVMPCLNEAKTLGACIRKALASLESAGATGEVIIADNGSTDGSQAIATAAGARVVEVAVKGYGAALRGGIEAAQGQFIIMGDSDDSYDFANLKPFIEKLREGYDLVMGNRFAGGIYPGAMPALHRYLGNPVLSFLGRLLFRTPIRDFHCGLRGFRKDAFVRMDLRTTGMEFASEIVVKAALGRMKITEVPTTLRPDGRDRPPHLRSWHDGWRHLRFLLIFSPRWLFLYPGALMAALGAGAAFLLLLSGSERTNSFVLSLAFVMMGGQSIFFAVLVRAFAEKEGLLPRKQGYRWIHRLLTLEHGVLSGAVLFLLGVAGISVATVWWGTQGFGAFPKDLTRFLVIPSAFGLIMGVQVVLNSFVLSIVSLEHIGSSKGGP